MSLSNLGNAIPRGCISAILGCVLLSGGFFPNELGAQEAAPTQSALTDGQKEVAGRFSRLEDLLLRSADLEAGENPTRAALLQQAVQLSKQAQLADLMAKAATNLESKQYSEAIEMQKSSRESLKRLLELLQSENREERVREKRDQVRRWIEETDRLLRLQSSLRGRTEGGQEAQQAAGDQNKLAEKAESIARDLKGEQETSGEQGSEPKSTDTEPKDGKSSEAADGKTPEDSKANGDDPSMPDDNATKPDDKQDAPNTDSEKGEAQQGEPKQGQGDPKSGEEDSKQGEPKQGQGQSKGEPQQGEEQPKESEPQQGAAQPSESKGGESEQGESQQRGESKSGEAQQPQPSQDPTERARQRIEQAQKRMQEAQAELENAEREGAVEKQLQAENDLREAIEELEEILRQLREEEIERSLASLETRLRRMLEMQIRVRDETKRLQEISGEQAVRQVEIRASSLSRDERKILADGERAYLLLLEEGSSAAFPEAIQQVNADIAKVADRLDAADVGRLTLVIEDEIVISLEEMVAALVQVQKDNKEKQKQQQQQGQQQQGEPGDQPLVDKLAEIRLIRTLQIRINNRTEALSKMLADPADPIGQVSEGEVFQELQALSERQASIQTVTRDIVIGKGE